MLRFAPTLVICAALAAGCASSRPAVEGVHAAYTTHFEGIPDRAAICARVTNRRNVRVAWIELRLRAAAEHAGRPSSWSSRWVYAGAVEPGETIAVELVDPPVAQQIRLRASRAGTGQRPTRGRPLRRVAHCSGESIDATLAEASAQRTARDLQVHAIEGAQPPASADWLAEDD